MAAPTLGRCALLLYHGLPTPPLLLLPSDALAPTLTPRARKGASSASKTSSVATMPTSAVPSLLALTLYPANEPTALSLFLHACPEGAVGVFLAL